MLCATPSVPFRSLSHSHSPGQIFGRTEGRKPGVGQLVASFIHSFSPCLVPPTSYSQHSFPLHLVHRITAPTHYISTESKGSLARVCHHTGPVPRPPGSPRTASQRASSALDLPPPRPPALLPAHQLRAWLLEVRAGSPQSRRPLLPPLPLQDLLLSLRSSLLLLAKGGGRLKRRKIRRRTMSWEVLLRERGKTRRRTKRLGRMKRLKTQWRGDEVVRLLVSTER